MKINISQDITKQTEHSLSMDYLDTWITFCSWILVLAFFLNLQKKNYYSKNITGDVPLRCTAETTAAAASSSLKFNHCREGNTKSCWRPTAVTPPTTTSASWQVGIQKGASWQKCHHTKSTSHILSGLVMGVIQAVVSEVTSMLTLDGKAINTQCLPNTAAQS